MTPEQVLSYPPRVLTQRQRESYFDRGYVLLERIVPDQWLERLRRAIADLLERSRALTESDRVFDLEDGHTAHMPRLRRVTNSNEAHPTFWAYCSAVAGRRHRGRPRRTERQVPGLQLQPQVRTRRHRGEVAPGCAVHAAHQLQPGFDRHHAGGRRARSGADGGGAGQPRRRAVRSLWRRRGVDRDHLRSATSRGSIWRARRISPGRPARFHAHNCRTVHGSARNESDRGRPLLITTYMAADSFAYRPHAHPHEHLYALVRGEPARWAHHDPRPNLIPPDWSQGRGFLSLFTWQQSERDLVEGRLAPGGD